MDAIKRYSPALQHAGGCTLPCMYPLADGDYVRLDDHTAVVAALEARLAEAEKERDEARADVAELAKEYGLRTPAERREDLERAYVRFKVWRHSVLGLGGDK